MAKKQEQEREKASQGQQTGAQVRQPSKFEIEFNQKINLLAAKRSKFQNKPEYKSTYEAIDRLHKALETEGKTYFQTKPTQKSYEAFKQNCNDHIKIAQPELDKHRGFGKILVNILAFVLSGGLGYLLAAGAQIAYTGKFTFFSTDSSKVLGEVKESVNKTDPDAAPAA